MILVSSMKKFIEKNKDYFIISGITLLIFTIIFLMKHIYPFGNNTLIYGDMYDQLTSYYYYIYDCFMDGKSFLINFSASSGINFFGIIMYYLFSPFTLLILLSQRSKIYLFISIIIVLKIVLCNITSLYLIKKLFKNMNSFLSVFLAMFYGFSIYSLNYYQITSWIDAMYMFPLIVIGLKKLFDSDNPKMYIFTLALSLYFSFYVSLMAVICIFLLSIIYIHFYVKKSEQSKKMLELGISTVLSIGCALLAIIPTYKQISISARMGFGLETLINSKMGPITDKIILYCCAPLLFVALILLLKDYKKHKKFLQFYIPAMTLLLIPLIVEPVNKLLHFGSYAAFPYRFGFVTVILLIIGAAYYFNSLKLNDEKISLCKKIISIAGAIFSVFVTIFITVYKYDAFQQAIDDLTISKTKILAILLILMFVVAFISIFVIFILNKCLTKLSFILIFIVSIVHIFCTSYIYVGIEFIQDDIRYAYENMNVLSNEFDPNDYYRYKTETTKLITNSSNVIRFNSLDHFSSLTDGNNLITLKRLGYTSYWTKSFSRDGTLFSDILLGNKYILSNGSEPYNYHLKNQYDDLSLYEYDDELPFGYFVNNNVDIEKYPNTFSLQNAIYQSITNKEEDIFEIVDDIDTLNIDVKGNKYNVSGKDNYARFSIDVKGKKKLYLEVYHDLNNIENEKLFKLLKIYVNGELIRDKFPDDMINGVVDLGVFENEQVNVNVVFTRTCTLKAFQIGMLNLEMIDDFVKNYSLDYDIEFKDNNIHLNIDSEEKDKLLFIPVNYNKAYRAYNNGKKVEIVKVYNNYIGIKLNEGNNDINITFVPDGLKSSLIISIIFIITTIGLICTKLYKKLIGIEILQKIARYAYLSLYGLVLLGVYLLPMLAFVLSLFIFIKL